MWSMQYQAHCLAEEINLEQTENVTLQQQLRTLGRLYRVTLGRHYIFFFILASGEHCHAFFFLLLHHAFVYCTVFLGFFMWSWA